MRQWVLCEGEEEKEEWSSGRSLEHLRLSCSSHPADDQHQSPQGHATESGGSGQARGG